MERISAQAAAKLLGIPIESLITLEKEGLIHSLSDDGGSFYSSDEILRIKSRHGLTLAEEATQVGIQLQREAATSLSLLRKMVMIAGAGILAYVVAVAVFVILYSFKPTQTAEWISQKSSNFLQALFQPAGEAALGILKYARPVAYEEAAKVTILDTNDVLTVDKSGSITPAVPITIPSSEFLKVLTNGLIENLNAQFLQGKIPGTVVGDIAVIGAVGSPDDDSVSTKKLENGSVTSEKIGNGEVTSAKIESGAVTSEKLEDNAVTSEKIGNGEVTNADLSQITAANKVAGSAVELSDNGGLTDDSGLSLLTSCADSEILKWNNTANAWECQADQGSLGSGITSIREGGVTIVSSAAAIDFLGADFTVSEFPATVGAIAIDYTNSKIVRSDHNETITGNWTFNSTAINLAGASTVLDMAGSGALGINTTTNRAITFGTGAFTQPGNYATPKGFDWATTGTQNNVTLGTGSLFRYTGASTATFTGLAGGTDGREVRIMNVSSSDLVLNNQDLGSLAANRIATASGANITVNTGGVVSLQYDAGASLWRTTAFPAEEEALNQGGNTFGTTLTLGTTDANTMNFVTAGNTRFSVAAGGAGTATLTGTGTTTFASGAGSALNVTSGTTGAVTLDSGTSGTVNVGTGATAKTINIGNAAVANTITIGSSSATGVSITDDNWSISTGGLITTANDIAINGGDITSTIGLNFTPGAATDFFNILNGNLKVGNGTPDLTLNGEDGYVEGTFEVDGAARFDGAFTLYGAATFNDSVSFADNLAVTSDLSAGTVNVFSAIATPSTTAGTANGLFVQQADSANTNGLDNGLTVDNADTNLAIGAAIKITNTGGGGGIQISLTRHHLMFPVRELSAARPGLSPQAQSLFPVY